MILPRFPKPLLLAWGLFLISLLLPAVKFGDGTFMAGCACAWVCVVLPFDPEARWDGETIYYFLFTVPNLFMLASPWILRFRARKWTAGWVLKGFALTSTLYNASFWVVSLSHQGPMALRVGYFVWVTSFVALSAIMIRMMPAPDLGAPPLP